MSLIYIDGFDNVAVGTLAAKGWAATPGNSLPSSMPTGRNGGQGLLLTATSGTSRDLRRSLTGSQEHATIIVGFAMLRSNAANTTLLQLQSDSFSTTHLTLSVNSSGQFVAARGGTTLGTSAASPVVGGVWGHFEVLATLSSTVGVVTIRYNGATVLTLTGQNTKNGGTKTVFDTMTFGPETGSGTQDLTIDDLYICNGAGSVNNGLLGDSKVQTISPDGNGNSSQMVGSDGNSVNNYQLVNALLPQTTTYVGSATTDNEDTYSYADVSSGATVLGVQISAYATKTDAGSRSLALVTRRSGTDYASSDIALPTGSQAFVQQVLDNDPSTSAAWTAAGLNSAEFGVRAR